MNRIHVGCVHAAKLAKSVKLFKAVVKYKSKVCHARGKERVAMHYGAQVLNACPCSFAS